MRTTKLTLALLVVLAGCVAEDGFDTDLGAGSVDQAVIGGLPSTAFPAACVMNIALPLDEDGVEQDPIVCSCSLVGEAVVLTAARCVEQNVDELADIEVRFGSASADPIPVVEVALYRYFDPEVAASEDIALVRLESSPDGVAPVELERDPLGTDLVGADVSLVGFGVNQVGDEGSTGALRVATTPVVAVRGDHIIAGTEEVTTCAGDSGGPVFQEQDGQQVQIAMTTYQDSCNTMVRRLRIDLFAEEFIDAYLRKVQGCVDCEPCDWNDDCDPERECPTRDWDCPLGSFVGEACEGDRDCEEGGRCIAAVDDESFTFCSRPCDPAADAATCPIGMECSDLGDGSGECAWLAPSPGSQGFECTDSSQCRSGICEDTICVFPCDPGQADACAEPYVCGPSKVADGMDVCLGQDLSGGGGFCAVSPAGSRGGPKGAFFLTLLSVLGMALILRRR